MSAAPSLRIDPKRPSMLRFGEQTEMDSKGRNGFLLTTGVEVNNITGSNTVLLFPVNSRGEVSEACRIAIHRDAIDDLIAALKDAKERR